MTGVWSGHWHGYGPWVGTRQEYADEHARRPGEHPADDKTRAFLTSTLPPMQVGHYLMRRSQASRSRTWTELPDVLDWLKARYAKHPPATRADGGHAYLDLDARLATTADSLRHGSDVVWAYYTGGFQFVSIAVVCCPNRFLPRLPCPLP